MTISAGIFIIPNTSVFGEEKLEEIKGDILQVGQVKEKIGKGYRYPVIGRMLGLILK